MKNFRELTPDFDHGTDFFSQLIDSETRCPPVDDLSFRHLGSGELQKRLLFMEFL